jgi:hypothetical protein
MDKNSLKKVIKPLIKECLTEILYEQGLNKLIEESIKTKQREVVKENKEEEVYEAKEVRFIKNAQPNKSNKLQEAKKQLLQKISMNGFDPFAGSAPLEGDPEQIAESINPEVAVMPGIQGSGVDISGLLGQNKQLWKSFSTALNGKGKKE